jgi:predicted metal-dependent hydrolase
MRKNQIENTTFAIEENQFALTIVRSHHRRRSISLAISPNSQLILRAPFKTNTKTIENMIKQHSNWILQKLSQLHLIEKTKQKYEVAYGDVFYYLGQPYQLKIIESAVTKPNCALSIDALTVTIKPSQKPNIRQQEILKILTKWCCNQAMEKTRERMLFWSNVLNVKFNKLSISRATKRWGSCSTINNIRINWRLIMAPPALLDYVVVHELCHVVHKNHSERFWGLVASVMPDYKDYRRTLKKPEWNSILY